MNNSFYLLYKYQVQHSNEFSINCQLGVSFCRCQIALLDEMKHFLWLIVVLGDSAFARYGVNLMDATRDDLSDTVNVVDSLVRCVN